MNLSSFAEGGNRGRGSQNPAIPLYSPVILAGKVSVKWQCARCKIPTISLSRWVALIGIFREGSSHSLGADEFRAEGLSRLVAARALSVQDLSFQLLARRSPFILRGANGGTGGYSACCGCWPALRRQTLARYSGINNASSRWRHLTRLLFYVAHANAIKDRLNTLERATGMRCAH
jgi:hypothetical protein